MGLQIIDWGKWYGKKSPQEMGIIDVNKEQLIKRRVSGRNLLLSSKSNGAVYINNMYPVNTVNARYIQLVDIFVNKKSMESSDVQYIKSSPKFDSRSNK